MRQYILKGSIGLGLGAGLLIAPFVTRDTSAQEIEIVDSAITLSGSGRAELWFELEGGAEHRLRFDDGTIEFDGTPLGSYLARGEIASAWQELLREHAGSDGRAVRQGLLDFRRRLAAWEADGTGDSDAVRELGVRLDRVFGLVSESVAVLERGEAGQGGRALQIVPGGLGFDVSGQLDRLRDALERLGDVGRSVDDQLAMIVHGDHSIPARGAIDGHIALLDGTLRLQGEVAGDVLILDGRLILSDGGRIRGNVLRVGGVLEVTGDVASIEGEILSDVALSPPVPVDAVTPVAPVVDEVRSSAASERRSREGRGMWARFSRNLGQAGEGLWGAITTFLGLAALGLLIVYFAQGRLETVSDTVRHEFARSFAMGLAGQVLFFPALLVLVVLVITWPIVPFFALGAVLAGLLGYVAVAHGAGEMFAQRRYRYEWLERLRRSNSYYYVISGLVLLLLPFVAGAALWVLGGAVDVVRGLIVFVACVGTWVLATAGFGSVLLTRAGGRSIVVEWSPGAEPDPATPSEPSSGDAADAEPSADDSDDA